MLRKEWAFEYTAAQLADAAFTKMSFHKERLDWWKTKKAEVMDKIRSEGLEVDEKIALGYRSPKARDWERGAQVMVRNDLQHALDECLEKRPVRVFFVAYRCPEACFGGQGRFSRFREGAHRTRTISAKLGEFLVQLQQRSRAPGIPRAPS